MDVLLNTVVIWLCVFFFCLLQNDSTDYAAYSSGGSGSGQGDYESLWEGDGNALEMDENELRISWNSGFFTRSRNVISLSLDQIVRLAAPRARERAHAK